VKVALDISCLALNPHSGLAEVARNLLSHMVSIAKRDEITVFKNYFRGVGGVTPFLQSGIRHYSLRIPPRIVGWWWKKDWPLLDTYLRDIDVFHGLHVQVPPARKIKTVLTVHDCRYLALPHLYKADEVEAYRKQMTQSLNRATRIGADSEFTRRELSSYFSIPEDRIRVIHNGFKPWSQQVAGGEEKAQVFLERRKIPQSYLLFLGVLDPRKNLRNLIEAFSRCKGKTSHFPDLLLVGIHYEHWIKSEEAQRAGALGVFNRIHVAGVIEKDLVWSLTKKAVALCYPSLYEGFGFPPLEAMSVGVPVLAGRASSIPEVAGEAACLVDPLNIEEMTEGLTRIVSDTTYRQELIRLGHERVTKFSWEKFATQYLSLYHEAVHS
jgi:alpha-1,3-rhamnosyl/mannosyltransferase